MKSWMDIGNKEFTDLPNWSNRGRFIVITAKEISKMNKMVKTGCQAGSRVKKIGK